jgi:hypothetical protein
MAGWRITTGRSRLEAGVQQSCSLIMPGDCE